MAKKRGPKPKPPQPKTEGPITKAIVRALRRRKWSVYQLIQKAEVNPDPVYRWANGSRTLTLDTVERLVSALGLEVVEKS
jgi:ribosome-binding protein aMBF1 (putative translation factor)